MTTDLRYERWFLPFSVPFGLGPKQSEVRVADGTLRVRFGWGFRADIPLTAITDAKPNNDRVYSWGAHGWRGRWLVNGSSSGLVRFTLQPAARAWMGPVPLRVRVLRVSVEDPDGLVAAGAS